MNFPPHVTRLVKMLPEYKGRLLLALLGMMLTAATEPALAAMMRLLLDRGFAVKPTFSLWAVPVFVIGIFMVRGISTYTTTYMMTWVSTRLLNTLRQQMFVRLLDVPLGYYASNSVGRVINSIMFEVQQVIDMLKNLFSSLIRDALTVIGLLGYLLWLNWRLTIIALVLLPVIAVVVRMTGKRIRSLTNNYLSVNADLTQVIEETTRAQHVIKIFGGHLYEQRRFEERADKLRSYNMRMASTSAATVPITQVITACAVSLVIVIALVQAGAGQTTVGGFASFITAKLMLFTPQKHLAEVNGPLQRGPAAKRRWCARARHRSG
jgi:ATP-binding cassette, subfamily B, bacterial MsbA